MCLLVTSSIDRSLIIGLGLFIRNNNIHDDRTATQLSSTSDSMHDSGELDERRFAASPKYNNTKYSNVALRTAAEVSKRVGVQGAM